MIHVVCRFYLASDPTISPELKVIASSTIQVLDVNIPRQHQFHPHSRDMALENLTGQLASDSHVHQV
jgi:hypothetical protein